MLRASEIVQPAGEDMNRVRNRSADAIDIDGDIRVDEDDAAAKAEAADQVDELRVAAAAAADDDKLTSVSRVQSTSSANKSVVQSLSKQL